MRSLEKRQANRRGSTRGSRKCSDGVSETSSVGSFMDDTDREVSSLTDRAFRSLCVGEDAIYNDLEVSSPADHEACPHETLQKKDLTTTCQESSLHGIQYEEAERKSEVASTFQNSYVDIAQEHALRNERLSYVSNGSMEVTWQQKRSTSRVSSLIKALSSGENHCDSGAPDTVKDKYQDYKNESWDKSALLSIQRELAEFSSGYHSKSGPLPSDGNNFHTVAQINTATSSKTKFKALNTSNFFFHSEFSPFQLWKDYNRFPFESGDPFMSATEYPRWYDSPLYKELAATQRISSSPAEGWQFTRRKIEDAASQRSRSTVIQKASAIEKRCESEIASNCAPWKNNNFVRNKLPSNRPSTVSPSNDKVHRPDSSLLYHSRHAYEIQNKVGRVGNSEMSSRTTPFNITQLLTPVIPGRQETETSEILHFAHSPLECDSDLKSQSDIKLLRDSYKSKASSLLFNLKDNRKRVKSTYSPPKFKGSEVSERNKQPSKLEGRESRLSEASVSKVPNQEQSTAAATWDICSPVQPNDELSLCQTSEHKQYADKLHNNMTLVSQYGTTSCNFPYLGSQNHHPDLFPNRENEHYDLSTNYGLGNNVVGIPSGHINHSSRTLGSTKPEIENIFSKAHLSAEIAAKQISCRREDVGHQNIVRKPTSGYIDNQVLEENHSWKGTGHVHIMTKEMVNNKEIKDALPYKGEIAALIEMDKQRKATAKQYLPSANESYTMKKETCINKVNENGSWLSKDKQIEDTKSPYQTYADKRFSNNLVQDDPTNIPATSQNVYECQQRRLQKMATKETNYTRGAEVMTHKTAEVCLQRNMKHATSSVESEKDSNQRTQFLQSMDEKYQYNEGSVAYQPYKYESNKQWHIATTENRHTKCEEFMSQQLQQSGMKVEQPGELNYLHSLSRTSCIQQQSLAYSEKTSQRNFIIEDGAKTEEHNSTHSIASSQIYHKQGDMNTSHNRTNPQSTLQNNSSSQTRGDRFSINDILSVRDNEQAKRLKENKQTFNGKLGDPTKLQNLTSPVTADIAEDVAAKTEPSKFQSHAQQDGNSHCKHEKTKVSYGYVRKESHIPNDVKERSGKDILLSNENDKITLRALSYKEKGQTKQEILTSKLKAHAQKEISAIKEKGLAKHAIPSRNPIKQSTAVNNEKGQLNQEVLSPMKEITAEKLNHLFQDITYSSVPLYKEQRNQSKDEPKYESITTEKVELPTRDIGSEKHKDAAEKDRTNTQMIQPQVERITVVDKKNSAEVQKFVKNYVHQLNIQSKENQIIKPCKDEAKERSANDDFVVNGTNPAKCFSSSPTFKVFNDEESVAKKEEKMSSNPSKAFTSDNTFKSNINYSPKDEKAAADSLTLYNISGNAVTLESSITKTKEQLPDINTDKPADTNTVSLKCHETINSKDDTKKENHFTLPNARQHGADISQDKNLLDLMNTEVTAAEERVELTDTKTDFANEQKPNTEEAIKHLQTEAGESENQTVPSESPLKVSNQVNCKSNPKPLDNETWLEKQKSVQTSKTNDEAFPQQLHYTAVDALKSSHNEHASKELEDQTTLSFSKSESMTLDSAVESKCSLRQDPTLKNLNSENSRVQETGSQTQVKNKHEKQNQEIILDKKVPENNKQRLQEDSERAMDTEDYNQNAMDLHEFTEATPMKKKQSNDDIQTCLSNDSDTECENSEEKIFIPTITINSKDQQLSSDSAPDKTAETGNPVTESHVIHIASKEDGSQTDEPFIYSICVSSQSQAVSKDEPIIFSISVSSLSDTAMQTGPEKPDKSQQQHSIEQVEKDDKETFGNKHKESDFLESKEEIKEAKLHLNNDMAEQETVVRKYDSPASKDKLDYYRSTEVDNISSSYESLLAKYGLPSGDTFHLQSDQTEQDKKQGDENKDSTPKCLHNTMYNENSPAEKLSTSSDFIKKHSPDLRKSRSLEASPDPLREIQEQIVSQSEQEHHTLKAGGTQRADEVVYSDRKTKQDHSSKQEMLMAKFVPVSAYIVGTHTIPAKQIMANGNVQLKENKQVGQKVQAMEREQKVQDDDVGNKNIKMVEEKCQKDIQLKAGFHSANISNKSPNLSCDDLQQPSTKTSTNVFQVVSKTHDSQNSVNATSNTKSPTLRYRAQGTCERDALKEESLSIEPLQTRDKKALQNNRKELVCKSEFLEHEQAKFITSNEAKVSKVIVSQKERTAFTNEQTKDSGSQNQIKSAVPTEKTDQRLFTMPDIPLCDKEVYKSDVENKIQADTISIRGAVPPNNVSEGAQNSTAPANVRGTKAASAPSMREKNFERHEDWKWKKEQAHKESEIIKDEITPLTKTSSSPSSSSLIVKGNTGASCDSSKSDKNLKEAEAQPQDKNDDHFEKLIPDIVIRKISEQKEIKSATGTFKENNDVIRWDIKSSGKVSRDKNDLGSNVYHSQKNALTERKGNTYDGKNIFESNQNSKYHDPVLTTTEGSFTKTEITQREKKTARPEISALADYARLRVISAEDDTINEKDLLQKMNTHQKYNLSTANPQKVHSSSKQLSESKTSESLTASTPSLQVQDRQTYKITDDVLAGHDQFSTSGETITHTNIGSLSKSSDDTVLVLKHTESTEEKTLTNQSNTKKSLTVQDCGYSKSHEVHQQPQNPQASHPEQTKSESNNDPKLKQPVHAHMLERKPYPQVKKSVPRASIKTEQNNTNRTEDKQIKQEVKEEETTEELQYYIVSAMESETKAKNNHEPPSECCKTTSQKDLTEFNAPASRSNTSSPAAGKPIMFRVKDNTCKTSSVTKTVRPRFHRSLSEEFRIGSPIDSCSEKDKVEYNHETELKEFTNSPVYHEQSQTSHRLSRGKEIQTRNMMLSPGFMETKETRHYNRRSHMTEEDESRSLVSAVSENVESLAASSVGMTDSRGFDNEHFRQTYARPESSCYERPESVCYERPESACSDMRPASKPPVVPPKTEKALRRAKRLTSRRSKKAEDNMTSDSPDAKSIRKVSSLPASPLMHMSTHQSVQASPPISHYHTEPNYPPAAHSIVAHSFPVTQRKLLQDPNSGQIFMVDMPVQVKTKTFFDPETGKYLQLNVRQRSQSTLSQPASVEVLSHPYVVYPGFLPMSVSVSSLPSVRSSSQTSASAPLTEEPNQLKTCQEPSKQESSEPEPHRHVQQHNRPVYRTREQIGRDILHNENVRMTPRQTHIITMSELEDFAMENT